MLKDSPSDSIAEEWAIHDYDGIKCEEYDSFEDIAEKVSILEQLSGDELEAYPLFVEYENETLPKKYRKIEKIVFSSKFACPESGFTIEEIEPRLFSFNSPYGACEQCEGIGVNLNVDPNLVVPNSKKTIAEGAIEPWSKSSTLYYAQTLAALAKHYKFSLDIPWKKISKEIKNVILYGSDEEEIKFSYDDGYEKYSTKKTFEGVINNLERRYLETESEWKREEISQYQSETDCEKCKGMRLKDEALCVKIDKLNISEVSKKSISEAKNWFSSLNEKLNEKEKKIAQHILKEINERLDFLLNVGLDYLTLSRESGTLSGGESQRIRLASQIGSGLTGVIYVLDEPSIGLHQKDNIKLINALKKLRDLGNTVIVVEHDTETMENADHIIDLGPEAGVDGGKIVAQGEIKTIKECKVSITGNYLSNKKNIPIPNKRRTAKNGSQFVRRFAFSIRRNASAVRRTAKSGSQSEFTWPGGVRCWGERTGIGRTLRISDDSDRGASVLRGRRAAAPRAGPSARAPCRAPAPPPPLLPEPASCPYGCRHTQRMPGGLGDTTVTYRRCRAIAIRADLVPWDPRVVARVEDLV